MLLEQYGATLDERLRRRIFQRAEDRVPYLYLEGEDASAAAVRGFQFLRECLVVDQTGELQHVRAGDGKAAEVHGGQCAPSSRMWRGAPPGLTSVHGRGMTCGTAESG